MQRAGMCMRQLDDLREEMERKEAEGGANSSGLGGEGLGDGFDDIPVHLKEKIARLEHENAQLRAAASPDAESEGGSSASTTVLESKVSTLGMEVRAKENTIARLQAELQSLRKSSASKASERDAAADAQMQERVKQLETQVRGVVNLPCWCCEMRWLIMSRYFLSVGCCDIPLRGFCRTRSCRQRHPPCKPSISLSSP